MRRGAFALAIRDSIDGMIRDLAQWQQNLLDPTWYQLVLVPGLKVEQAANKSCADDEVAERTLADLRFLLSKKTQAEDSTADVFLPYDVVEPSASSIELSKTSLGIDRKSKEVVLSDRIQIPSGTNRDQSVSDVYRLVKFFSAVEPVPNLKISIFCIILSRL